VASISVCWQGLALTYLKGVDQADVSAALHLMAQRGWVDYLVADDEDY
jgi:hypothetical protein